MWHYIYGNEGCPFYINKLSELGYSYIEMTKIFLNRNFSTIHIPSGKKKKSTIKMAVFSPMTRYLVMTEHPKLLCRLW